ncbi:hypothetical protein Tco_1444676 [Tanacetum coccineum]
MLHSGYVDCGNDVWRMQGSLRVSRAIGDKHLGRRDTKAFAERLDDNNAQAKSQVTAVPSGYSRVLLLYWQEHPGCQITREMVTIDQHDELIKMGIKPTLKGVKWDQKFPYVIFCAPPSRSSEFRLCW